MTGSARVFVVRDMQASIEYYKSALEFEISFQYGDPPTYAYFCEDNVNLHFIVATQTKRLPGNGAICIFVDDVDAVHADILRRGARVLQQS